MKGDIGTASERCPFLGDVVSIVMANQPPSNATDAVLKPSDTVPADAREVQGIDFNDYAQRSITVEELMGGYARMGFQATAIGEAVRIVNDMVSVCAFPTFPLAHAARRSHR